MLLPAGTTVRDTLCADLETLRGVQQSGRSVPAGFLHYRPSKLTLYQDGFPKSCGNLELKIQLIIQDEMGTLSIGSLW